MLKNAFSKIVIISKTTVSPNTTNCPVSDFSFFLTDLQHRCPLTVSKGSSRTTQKITKSEMASFNIP
jgi:hypothetical protein